jgi:hypothetical protein
MKLVWYTVFHKPYCSNRDRQLPSLNANLLNKHERTTTAKNMVILKYHQTSLISYERCWPLACLDGLIKPGLPSGCQVNIKYSMLRVPILALIIETSAVWPWCRRSFQDICRGLDNYSWAYMWLIPMIFHMVCPSWPSWTAQPTVHYQTKIHSTISC